MRVEATVPDARGIALTELADELRLSRSQIIDEALALFMSAVLEVRRGRRLVTLGPAGTDSTREIVTPTLAQIEWSAHRQSLRLPVEAVDKITALVDHPPKANKALKGLMAAGSR
jgi:hypothetical protein